MKLQPPSILIGQHKRLARAGGVNNGEAFVRPIRERAIFGDDQALLFQSFHALFQCNLLTYV